MEYLNLAITFTQDLRYYIHRILHSTHCGISSSLFGPGLVVGEEFAQVDGKQSNCELPPRETTREREREAK
jgi:hypothetical protein